MGRNANGRMNRDIVIKEVREKYIHTPAYNTPEQRQQTAKYSARVALGRRREMCYHLADQMILNLHLHDDDLALCCVMIISVF